MHTAACGRPRTVAAELRSPLTLTVPLDAVRENELFAVHVTLESEATNDRGGESTSLAFIDDPEHVGPGLLKARGLKPLGKPHFRDAEGDATAGRGLHRETKPAFGQGAVEPRRVRRHRGRPHPDGARDPQCRIARRDQRHRAHERWLGALGTGLQAHDHTRHLRQQRHLPAARGDSDPRGQGGRVTGELHRFPVSPQCGTLGKQRHASVTILDDDPPPPPAAPTFTIGGTVDGLQGTGLVLTNLGPDVPVSANGSFTFPGSASAGHPYDVAVRSQPSNPRQVCTVQNGNGTVSNANVTDIAVHCTTPLVPLGLDVSFGNGGLVSTPVGGLGQGEAG